MRSRLANLFWGLTLLFLPVTSFRYFPFLGKSTFVRPLSFYPLALLYLVFFVQILRKEFRFRGHRAFTPLAAFLVLLVLSTAAGAILAPIPLRGNSYWHRALRGWVTMLIGLGFFFAAYQMNPTREAVKTSLRWLYGGLALTLAWAGVQAVAFYTPLLTKKTVSAWQRLFSTRGIPKLRRVSGLAFEPSWFAGQLAMIYLPWLTASILTGVRVTSKKWLEPILLLGALAALALSYSRGGILIVLAAGFITLLAAGRKNLRQSWRWFFHPRHEEDKRKKISAIGARAALLLGLFSLIFGATAFLARQKYVNRLWTVSADSLPEYFIKASAGGRVTYAWAAGGVFLEHPWLGVGFGDSGLTLYDHFPDWAMTRVPEIARQFTTESRAYPNPKNFYLRLLAETGILGAAAFLAFLLFLLSESLSLLKNQEVAFVGIAGLFSWLTISMYFLMQDSLAKPEVWISFAIVLGISATNSLPLRRHS